MVSVHTSIRDTIPLSLPTGTLLKGAVDEKVYRTKTQFGLKITQQMRKSANNATACKECRYEMSVNYTRTISISMLVTIS
jgi:hypothetical protein